MKLKNLGLYKDLAHLLYKYGTSDLVKNAGLAESLERQEKEAGSGSVSPEGLKEDLTAMGPAFIKLGQLLSTRPDLLPEPYIEALSGLQDNVPPFPYEETDRIFSEEVGVKIKEAFGSFDETPLASASIGQVHRATLRDGTKVVVKIQRPGIRPEVLEELEVLTSVASFLQKNTSFGERIAIGELIDYFKQTLLRELDYRKEAQHLRILRQNLSRYDLLVVPEPIEDFTTGKVLTMKYLKGKNITHISPLRKLELDGSELVDALFKAYLQQVVIDGFMHADPHPGNIHLTDDNKLALLDVGMVAYFGEEMREQFLKLLLHLGEANGDKLARLLQEMSNELDDSDPEQFHKEISLLVRENQFMTMKNLQTGKLIFELIRISADHGFVLPVSMSLLAKSLLNLDQVGAAIAPDFNPREAIREHTVEIMRKYVYQNIMSYHFLTTAMESKELLENLPRRMNKILGNMANNEWSVGLKGLHEDGLMNGFQKVANRIAMGLIIAALLIAAAMLMHVPSAFTLLGYPGLAMVVFISAVAGAVFMAVDIWFRDR